MPNIIAHELGHFLIALALGLPVKSFDVGTGEVKCEYFLGNISFNFCEIPVGGGVIVNLQRKHIPNGNLSLCCWRVFV